MVRYLFLFFFLGIVSLVCLVLVYYLDHKLFLPSLGLLTTCALLRPFHFYSFAVFQDENALIAKNSSVIVRRIPGLRPGGILSQQEMAAKNDRYAEKNQTDVTNGLVQTDPPVQDFPKTIEGADEADRIASLISQSSNALDMFPLPPNRGRYNNRASFRGGRGNRGGRGGRGARGAYGFNAQSSGGQQYGHGNNNYPDRAPRPSANYVCHRCNLPGHWIDQCPTNGDPSYDKIKVRAPTGIPRSMLRQVDAPESGTGLQDSSGQFVTLQPNEEEFARQTVGLRLSQAAAAAIEKGIGGTQSPSPTGERGNDLTVTAQNGVNHDDASGGPKEYEERGTVGDHAGATEAAGDKNEKTPTDGNVENEPSESKDAQQFQGLKIADSTAASTVEGSNTKPPNANGTHLGGGHGTSRHVNENTAHGRRGNNTARSGIPMPGMPPLQGAPPGFPMGLPPFPPGLPPPPPHILMAMAAAAQQGVMPPLPPGMIPPNVPFPFPPPMTNSDREGSGNDLAIAQQQGFQHFMTMMQGQGGNASSGGGEKPGESVADGQETRDGAPKAAKANEDGSELEPSPRVSNSQGEPVEKENCVESADVITGPGLDQSNSEKLECSQNSKSDSRYSRGRADLSGERKDLRKRDSYQNGKDASHDERNLQDLRSSRRQHHSPRDHSLSPKRRSPFRERCRSPSRKTERGLRGDSRPNPSRDSGLTQRGRGYEDRNARRELRRGRELPKSPPPYGRDRSGNHSPPRGRYHRSSRRRSPSPTRIRGRDVLNRAPRDVPLRGESPVSRRRYLVYRDEGGSRSPRRGRRGTRRTPSPLPRGRYDRRDSRRPRSPSLRSPPRSPGASRYGRSRRDNSRIRSSEYRRRSRSPEAKGSRDFSGKIDNDRVQHRNRRDKRVESRRYSSKPDESNHLHEFANGRSDVDMENGDHRMPSLAKERGKGKDGSPVFREGARSPRRGGVRGEERFRSEREQTEDDGVRPAKKARREATPEEKDLSGLEHRDRRSVHDRLGQPRERLRSRKSVHDRLG